ncbi:MAG: hypothetical protein IT243_00810 [Bacteroidia bacterium]|nr:hypothetical protein [Bacteroidia bacterium]
MPVINPYNPLGEFHNSLLTNLITTNPSPTIEEAIDILADSWATQCDDSTPNF